MSDEPVIGPQVCVGAVVIDAARLLLIRRGREPGLGRWSVPGGRVERGETLGEAVLRELAEETALEGICGPLVGWVERITETHHVIIFDFFVDVFDPEPAAAADDATDLQWVPLEDVAELDLADGLAEFLHENGVLETII